MIDKVKALVNLLRQGSEATHAAAWTNRAIVFNLLVAVLGVATAFGLHPSIDTDTLLALAGGIVAAVGIGNGVVHAATDDRVGLPPVRGTNVTAGGDAVDSSAPADIRDPGGA